jgi:nicotinate phosphoribosyltransferase
MTVEDSSARAPAPPPPAEPPRFQPAADVLSGETADVYFERAAAILRAEHLDPVVTMEIFARQDAILCGAEESLAYLREVLGNGKRFDHEPVVESLHDGDPIARKEVVMRITARYSAFGLYETALLGILAQSTGWATAARRVVEAAAPVPVIGFGARHVHPSVADQMDYASVVGGCIGASTPAGARLAGLAPTGTMPHALILIFGDTVKAVEAFDRHVEPDVPRIALVDTFKDEAEEALRVADALGDRLWGVRLDTPSERGRVTADLVKEVRARLDQAGHGAVRIVVSGGLDVERILYFKEAGAPIDSFAVGSAISDASPIDFTGDLKEIDGRPIAKRGRIPGITPNPRLERIDLHA